MPFKFPNNIPEFSAPPSSNWAASTRGSSEGLYRLALVDLRQTQLSDISIEKALGRNRVLSSLKDLGALEFVFRMNPREIDLSEPMAVSIQPTQNRGQYIEHQGQIYKDIKISGTTGLRPNKKNGAQPPVFSISDPFNTNPAGIGTGETTGFDHLLELRNLLRGYAACKVTSEARHIVMIWQNAKEGESYIVEPILFRTPRSAASPLTINYEIQLRTIHRLDIAQIAIVREDPLINELGSFNFIKRASNSIRLVSNSLAILTALTDRVTNVGLSVINDVLLPLENIVTGATALITTANRALTAPRDRVSITLSKLRELSDTLDAIVDNPYIQSGTMTAAARASKASKDAMRGLGRLYSDPDFYGENASISLADSAAEYNDPREADSGTGGSTFDPRNAPISSTAAVTTINGDENIMDLAFRVLGDPGRWKEIVVLNSLSAPYISEAGDGIDVLRPGDEVMYPSSESVERTGVSQEGVSRFSDGKLLDERLGRDLKLKGEEVDVGFEDFVVDRGDLGTVEGFDNLRQAVRIKFGTEQGELRAHPNFGFSFPIGAKPKTRTITEFQLNGRATLLSDRRISDVPGLAMSVSGTTLNVKTTLSISGIDDRLPIRLSVRR